VSDPLRQALRALAATRDPADDYLDWLHRSPTPFHAVASCAALLDAAGFSERSTARPLKIAPGDRFYAVHPDGKSLAAVVVGERAPSDTGFAIVAAHTDSPDLRLRPNPLHQSAGTTQFTTQFHGGLIRRAWLDRPLALAGACFEVVRDKDGAPRFHDLTGLPVVTRQLVHLDQPLAVIPDLAIHLDRDKNDKGAINPHSQLNAVIAIGEGGSDEVVAILAAQAGVDLARIDGFDLHLVPAERPARAGLDRSLLCGPRHDDLAMVWCGATALCAAVARDPAPLRTQVAAFFDAEETGSTTASGASSAFLRDLLVRVARHHPKAGKGTDPEQAFAHTVCISADMAHALHPNFADLHDKAHAPKIGQGPVIKVNSSDRYATSGETAAMFAGLCDAAGVAVQDFVVRQDLACGSTIGPITAARLAARVVDVGCPMWAMHSTRETCAAADLLAMVDVMRTFYLGGR